MTCLTAWFVFLSTFVLPAQDSLVVPVSPATDTSVGFSSIVVEGWQAPDAAASHDMDLGARSLVTEAPVGGRKVRLAFDWRQAASTPSSLWWSVDGAELQRASLTTWSELPTGDGLAYLLRLELAPGELPRLTAIVEASGEVRVWWDVKAVVRGHFDVEGESYQLLVVDGDSDGEFSSERDRWLAAPTTLVERLQLSNPNNEMRWLDEPSCLAGTAIRFVAAGDESVTLDVGGPHDTSSALRDHLARVQASFEESYTSTRRKVLVREGDDPERPTTDTPTTWWYATDVAAARAYAERAGKPLLLELTSQSCGYCRLQTLATQPDADVVALQDAFACVRLLSDLDLERSFEQLGLDGGVPHTLAFDDRGIEVGNMRGFTAPTEYAAGLSAALELVDD